MERALSVRSFICGKVLLSSGDRPQLLIFPSSNSFSFFTYRCSSFFRYSALILSCVAQSYRLFTSHSYLLQ